MHRFYLKGNSGRVGASWMTREDRMCDINDNMNWLSELIFELKNEYKFHQIYLFGFSQGGATALRLYHYLPQMFFSKLIIWANDFPEDMRDKKMYGQRFYVLGDQDEYIFGERGNEIIAQYREKGFKICNFQGSHKIHYQSLQEILSIG